MAYLYLGQAQAGRDNIRARDANYVKAMELSMRATEKERLAIEAFHARNIERDQEKYFKILQELRQNYPKEKWVFLLLALYYSNQDVEREIEALRAALELDPDYGDALNLMAYAHANLGNLDEALQYLERYANVMPGEANPYDSMAEIYFRKGDLARAIEKYEAAIEIKPGFLSCFPISYIYALQEDYETAFEWVDRFSSQPSDSGELAMAVFWRGLLHYWTGSRGEAQRELRESRRLWGVVGNRLYQGSMDKLIAWTLLDGGDPDTGLEIFTKDDEFRFKQWSAGRGNLQAHEWLFRSCCAVEKGEVDSAASYAKALKSILPDVLPLWQDHFRYQSGLLDAAVWLARGNVDSAVIIGDRAVPSGLIRANPEQLSWYMIGFLYRPGCDILARAYLEKGELENAVAEYERLTTYDSAGPDRHWIRPENHYALARLYEETGLKEKAATEYEEFLRIWQYADDGLPEKKDAIKRLAALRAS
jgi:tetratricopeptide (TPR) repeat protein